MQDLLKSHYFMEFFLGHIALLFKVWYNKNTSKVAPLGRERGATWKMVRGTDPYYSA